MENKWNKKKKQNKKNLQLCGGVIKEAQSKKEPRFSLRVPSPGICDDLRFLPKKLQELQIPPFCSLNEIWIDADINFMSNRGCRRSRLANRGGGFEGLTQWSAVRGRGRGRVCVCVWNKEFGLTLCRTPCRQPITCMRTWSPPCLSVRACLVLKHDWTMLFPVWLLLPVWETAVWLLSHNGCHLYPPHTGWFPFRYREDRACTI